MKSKFVCKVYNHFDDLTDRRVLRRTNYELIEMIFVALCAAICDANSWANVKRFGKAKLTWLRRYITLANGIPSHDNFGRVFARLDSTEFYNCLQGWASELAGCLRGESGLGNNGVVVDSTISLNMPLMNFVRSAPQYPLKYDLEQVTLHEIADVLAAGGGGS